MVAVEGVDDVDVLAPAERGWMGQLRQGQSARRKDKEGNRRGWENEPNMRPAAIP